MKKLLWLSACLALAAFFALLFALRSYRVFTGEELVAVVSCEPGPSQEPGAFQVAVAFIHDGKQEPPQKFLMRGDQWMIGGDILKWSPWLNLLGLKTCQKLTRLNSRYLAAADEVKKPRSVYDLNGGTDFFWRWLYRVGQQLPLVEAVYGNAAYTPYAPNMKWGVYATLSGYLVKRLVK